MVRQIFMHTALALPYCRHRGSTAQAAILRAVRDFGSAGRNIHDFAAVECARSHANITGFAPCLPQ